MNVLFIFVTAYLTLHGSGLSNIGTHFYVTFPPTPSGSDTGNCYLHFNAVEQTVVSIISLRTGYLESFTVTPPSAYRRDIDCAERVPSGHDNRLLRIIAQGPVTIQLETVSGNSGDMITLFPEQESGSYIYYFKSLTEGSCTNSNYDAVFYLVSNDEANVTLWDEPVGGNLIESFSMNSLSTYADYRSCNTNHDFTGWFINSTSPLAVVSGSLYTQISALHDDTVLSTVLDADLIYDEYVIPPIRNPRSPSYSTTYNIRIISFNDDNILAIFDNMNVPIFAKYMSQNEVFTYTVPDGWTAHIVRCTFDCIVYAYPARTASSGGGHFLYQQPSSQRGADTAIFNQISTRSAMLTVVSNTMTVYHNGDIISGWEIMEGNNLYYAMISLLASVSNTQAITVDEGNSFQCYLHGEITNYDWYGDVVGVGDIPLNKQGKHIISDDRMDNVKKELSLEL